MSKLKSVEVNMKQLKVAKWNENLSLLRNLFDQEELLLFPNVESGKTFEVEESSVKKYMTIVQVNYDWRDVEGNGLKISRITGIGLDESVEKSLGQAYDDAERSYLSLQFNLHNSVDLIKNISGLTSC